MAGVPLGVKARKYKAITLSDPKEKTVGKATQSRAAEVAKHDWIAKRMLGDPLNDAINLIKKGIAEIGRAPIIPITRLKQFKPRQRQELDVMRHVRARRPALMLSQLIAAPFSRSKLASRLSSSARCASGRGVSASDKLSHKASISARRSSALIPAMAVSINVAMAIL